MYDAPLAFEYPLLGTARQRRREPWRRLAVVTILLVACIVVGSMSMHLRDGIAVILASLAFEAEGFSGQPSRQLIVSVEGRPTEFAIVTLNSTSPSLVVAYGAAITISNDANAPADVGTRAWVARDHSLQPDSYPTFSLLGKSLSYTVDMNAVGCACNAALYWVSMPGFDQHNVPAAGPFGNYYCDANQVNGIWCWEHDTSEANRYAMQVAPHECSAPSGQYIGGCDKAGASRNTWMINKKGLCPQEDCIIDSRRPFRHIQTFVEGENATLAALENRLEQGGRAFSFRGSTDTAYLARMSAVLERGMVLTFQLWGGPREMMSWLDGFTGCTGECPAHSHVTYSDVRIDPFTVLR
jgi:hypothetical protein